MLVQHPTWITDIQAPELLDIPVKKFVEVRVLLDTSQEHRGPS